MMIKHKQHIIILFLFALYSPPISASNINVQEVANKLIIGDTDIHYSEMLRVIAKYEELMNRTEMGKTMKELGTE